MTISSLAKYIAGVNRMVVGKVKIESPETDPTIIISVRTTKRDSCRCGICGKKCIGYDQGNGKRRWRALDIGNGCKVFLESDSPRVWCKEHGAVTQMVPWARHGSKHTRIFEDTAAWMSLHISRKAVSDYLRVSWDTVGPMISRVEKETRLEKNRFENLVRIGIDETSYKKGHKYITVVINHDTNAVIWAGKGFGKEVLEKFFNELTPMQRKSIQFVSGDGAKWIKDTVGDYCPEATFCIDPFHVVSWCEEVLDTVRKQQWNEARRRIAEENKEKSKRGKGRPKGGCEKKTAAQKEAEIMKGSKYPLLMNPDHLNESYRAKLQEVLLYDRRLATAYRLKEGLRAIFHLPAEEIRDALEKWRRRAWSSRIPEFVDLQRKIRRHLDAIVATVAHQISNARVESMNNKIKLTIRMAYGFRNIDNLIALIYLRCGRRIIYLPGRAPE
ncbi:MAG: ISL3 family transposase [Clostridia bacterium]|nr:ISL3 family transposase [Clostridia bacterium]